LGDVIPRRIRSGKLRLYLEVSCLNRPFDDQNQTRIRLEAEAVTLILEKCGSDEWEQISSEMADIEIDAITDSERRARVRLLLPEGKAPLRLSEEIFARAETVEGMGFKRADAVHLAAAESQGADAFLSCDDRLCRRAKRQRDQLKVHVANPLDWLKEIGHDPDA
jgi:predicted nucleic acid-binding protein